MHFAVKATPAGGFDEWLTAAYAEAWRLDNAEYKTLARQCIRVPLSTHGGVDASLFERVVRGGLAPGPDPGTEDSSAHGAARVSINGH